MPDVNDAAPEPANDAKNGRRRGSRWWLFVLLCLGVAASTFLSVFLLDSLLGISG
jgi:hypothetical protein